MWSICNNCKYYKRFANIAIYFYQSNNKSDMQLFAIVASNF